MNIWENLNIESLPSECWNWIPGYRGSYKVSNLGRVMSVARRSYGRGAVLSTRILRQRIDGWGYLVLFLSKNGKSRPFSVHALVAKAFIKEVNKQKQVNHKNGDKKDNLLSNLEWVTPSENLRHAYSIGLKKPLLGEDNPGTNISNKKAIELFNCPGTLSFLSKKFGVTKGTAFNIKSGKGFSCVTGKKRNIKPLKN